MNMRKAFAWVGFGLVLALAACGPADDGLSKDQRETKDRFATIMERSGGQWEKLTDEDREWIVNSLSNGNEQAAKTMFMMRANRNPPGQVPGGPGGPN